MVTLRCTRKLLRRLGVPAEIPSAQATTVLGDWYGNLYYTRPHQMVLCLNERTLLAVLIGARDANSLGSRFRDSVIAMLSRLGVPSAAVDAEARSMADVAFGPTANRRILGCLNEAAYAISAELDLGRRTSLTDLELFLSENIYSPTGYRTPRELVAELFAGWDKTAGGRS